MSEAKFTKSKWIIGKSEDDYKALSIDVKCGEGLIELASISGVIDCRYECEESKANAHLMAAAPEMYEMLNDIAISMECEHGVDTNAIFALLAKARGEL